MKSISFLCPLIEKLSYSSCEIRIFIKADSPNEAFNEKGKKSFSTRCTKIVSFISAPGKPSIVPEDCSAENNSVTIAWQPHMGKVVESYSLELDDGCGGDFRVRDREIAIDWCGGWTISVTELKNTCPVHSYNITNYQKQKHTV